MRSKTPTYIDADVLVIGGGAAGVAAAYSAARNGAHVVLVEKNGFLGGMATAAYVGTICGLYARSSTDRSSCISGGFMKFFAAELAHRSKSEAVLGQKGLRFLPYVRSAFISLCDDVLDEVQVHVLFHATASRINLADKAIHSVEVITDNGLVVIRTKSVIDASGNALVGHLIDEMNLIESKSYQSGAYVFGLNQIKLENELHLNMYLIKALKTGIESGALPDDKSWISVIPGSLNNGMAFFKLSIPFALHKDIDALSKAEQYARKRVVDYVHYLKKTIIPMAHSQISWMAPAVGVRTGPRYQGKYVLSEEDVLSCKKFNNSAARGAWPIEYWEPGKPVQMTYFDEDDYYDIPTACLACDEIENLFFAGRHISAEENAIASARVIGTCLQMGESAGKMASDYGMG